MDKIFALIKNRQIQIGLLLGIVVFLIFFPIYYYRINYPVYSDFGSHMLFTRYLIRGEIHRIPIHIQVHSGLQLILTVLYRITFRKVNLGILHTLVVTGSQAATALILYFWMRPIGQKAKLAIQAFFAGTLTLLSPIALFIPWDGQFYFGYISLVNFHNPTILLLRPFALLSFVLLVKAFEKSSHRWTLVLASFVLTLSTALIKPSYLVSILPGVVVFAFWKLFKKQEVDKILLFGGFLGPSIAALGIQWLVTYSQDNSNGSAIIFEPLKVVANYSDNLVPKFFLSILLPLLVTVFFARQIKEDNGTMIAWLGFFSGAAQMYLLAESGERLFHANFFWGAQIMAFLLFSAVIRWYYQKYLTQGIRISKRSIPIFLVYTFHLVFGIAYYIRSFFVVTYW